MNLKDIFETKKNIHFIGIGGISMHALAIFLRRLGFVITGSDLRKTDYEKEFLCNNIEIQIGHKVDLIKKADVVIINGAIKEDNKELIFAKEKNLVVVDRAELLAYVCSHFPKVIAIAGSHGKTTTSAMLYTILRTAGKSVSCHIGGNFYGSRLEYGDEYLVVEACEYNKSFLHLLPFMSVVTNVDVDHIDSYGSFDNLKDAFRQFLNLAQKQVIYLSASTEYLKDEKVLTCNDNNFYADDIVFNGKLKNTSFVIKDKKLKIHLNTLGKHNIKNALLASRVAVELGIDNKSIIKGLAKFRNVERRAEILGKYNKKIVLVDYAHHPTEIECFLDSMKATYKNTVIIFQPHTFSRTLLLCELFIYVLASCKNLIIFKEYSARETANMGFSAFQLYKLIKKKKADVKYAKDFSTCKSLLNDYKKADAFLFVGAGDIIEVAKKLLIKKVDN